MRVEKCNFSQAMKEVKQHGPRKRVRTEAELNEAAERFGKDWTSDDLLVPWIRRHEPELTAMVKAGWSWAQIGDAMARAKITYKTGQPLSGPVLRVRICEIRKERGLSSSPRQAAQLKPATNTVRSPVQSTRTEQPGWPSPVQEQRTAEPEFRPVSLHQPYTPPSPAQAPRAPKPKQPQRSEEEVMALLRGSAPKGT